MRLATFDDDCVGVVRADGIVDVSDMIESAAGISRMRQLIEDHESLMPHIEEAAATRRHRPLSDVALQVPISDPSKIVAAPVNYQDHREEMRLKGDVRALGFFLKAPSSLLRPNGVIRLPYPERRIDHEAEFALIIGRRARHVGVDEALNYVFGYTGLIDVTMRGEEERSMRKSFDTFTPLGPWLVTPDEMGDPENVGFTLSTNDVVRQKGNTRGLIWSVARFISYVSTVTTLLPGDVVSTGTPAGVSPIVDGDTVALDVDRVGRLSVSVSACESFRRSSADVDTESDARAVS